MVVGWGLERWDSGRGHFRRHLAKEFSELFAHLDARPVIGAHGNSGRGEIAAEEFFADSGGCDAVDSTAVAEADFDLGGMDVDIDILRRHLQHQHGCRMPARFGQSTKRFAQGMLHQTIADVAAVEIQILISSGGAGEFR